MAKSTSVIEINGNRYDAVSGQLVGAVKKVAEQVRTPAGGAIDGLVRRPATVINQTRKRTGATAVNAHRKLQRSQTLMRGAVKRPDLSSKVAIKPATAQKAHVAPTGSTRLLHAKTVTKNKSVEHFGKFKVRSSAIVSRKALTAPQPAKKTAAATALAATAAPMPSQLTSVSHQHLERMLDHALINASSHKQRMKAEAKGLRRLAMAPKWMTVGVSSLIVILLAGFYAWQNVPQVSMRVAATQAHISASVPAYAPMGFNYVAPVSADGGKVSINYKAPESGSYTITQQNSTWDSSTVAASAVPAGAQVQTSQVNGTTVYIYGQHNDAMWVNHGVYFTLDDKANLSSDQILQIANSL